MKWRFGLACGMLILVVCAGIFVQYRIQALCDELCCLLETEREEETSFAQAKKLWNNSVTTLSVLIRHDRIDNITESFARAEAFLGEGTEDEYRAEAAQLISKLIWLREYDQPGFRSIF